jgi:hypothetical protein
MGLDLRAALAKLPMPQRQAVVLHHVGGMSLAEIAVLTGVAEGTVKSRLHGRAPRSRGCWAATMEGRGWTMPERDDWLDTAFDAMCRAAEPRIRSAGPHSVRETVRRRRSRRLHAVAAAVLAGLLIGVITLSAGRGNDAPLDRGTPTPETSSAQPSPEPRPA